MIQTKVYRVLEKKYTKREGWEQMKQIFPNEQKSKTTWSKDLYVILKESNQMIRMFFSCACTMNGHDL